MKGGSTMKKQNVLGKIVKEMAGKQAEHEGIPMNFNAFFCISTTATYYDQSINKCPNMR